MMRMTMAIFGAALIGALLPPGATLAQSTSSGAKTSVAAGADASAQSRRSPRRIQIYPRRSEHWQPDVEPRYNPGPDAVRVCNATYVQEARPSGTVIVPRMSCYWRRG
jgi:hypothetical protein